MKKKFPEDTKNISLNRFHKEQKNNFRKILFDIDLNKMHKRPKPNEQHKDKIIQDTGTKG